MKWYLPSSFLAFFFARVCVCVSSYLSCFDLLPFCCYLLSFPRTRQRVHAANSDTKFIFFSSFVIRNLTFASWQPFSRSRVATISYLKKPYKNLPQTLHFRHIAHYHTRARMYLSFRCSIPVILPLSKTEPCEILLSLSRAYVHYLNLRQFPHKLINMTIHSTKPNHRRAFFSSSQPRPYSCYGFP